MYGVLQKRFVTQEKLTREQSVRSRFLDKNAFQATSNIKRNQGRDLKKKYAVYGNMGASIKIGEYEAESEDEAIEMADADPQGNWYPSLCWQCNREIEIGDVYETEAVLVED